MTFPGALYDAHGHSLDATIPDLRQDELDAYPHRSQVTDRDEAPVARVWRLTIDAVPTATPSTIVAEAGFRRREMTGGALPFPGDLKRNSGLPFLPIRRTRWP